MSQLSQNAPTISKCPNYRKISQLSQNVPTISKYPKFLIRKVAERYEIHAILGNLWKMLKVSGSCRKCNKLQNGKSCDTAITATILCH